MNKFLFIIYCYFFLTFKANSQLIVVFEEHFNGEKLNLNLWHQRRPWEDFLPCNAQQAGSECENAIFLPENVRVSNGYLYLKLKPDGNKYHLIYYDTNSTEYTYPYSGGMIWSKKNSNTVYMKQE